MFDVCLVATPGAHWEQQWSYLLSHFKPRNIYVIGELDRRVRPFTTYQRVETAEDVPGTLVLMTPENGYYWKGETPLPEFIHPAECCYMFGADNLHMSVDQLGTRVPDHTVFIPTDTKDTMYSFMAGAITLYDRACRYG